MAEPQNIQKLRRLAKGYCMKWMGTYYCHRKCRSNNWTTCEQHKGEGRPMRIAERAAAARTLERYERDKKETTDA